MRHSARSIARGLLLIAALLGPSVARAQQRDSSQRDSSRRGDTVARRDSAGVVSARAPASGTAPEIKPPLSPRRAFLYSLALPGYAQSVLGRNRSSSLYMGFEAVAIVMIRESAGSLREARRNLADSVTVSYVDGSGQPAIKRVPTAFSHALVKSRQQQVEDWIAVLIGNHLFSGADAYVASLLWDLPAEVAFRASPRSTGLALRLYW